MSYVISCMTTEIWVGELDEIEPAVRASHAGYYRIRQIEDAPPSLSGITSRRWGVAIKREDGSVVVMQDSRPRSCGRSVAPR
jgi:hypothetical protein